MDAFYASIEQRDNEVFRGKPLAVGYDGVRGVVAAASYEARVFGVRSAMPSVTAKRRCPELIFTPARFDVYIAVSQQIRNIFLEYTDLVEPLSLDEAFLDVTHNHKNISSAIQIAKEIKQKIREVTGLTASAGVSYNKFLAKIASDYKKPDGLFVVLPQDGEKFVEGLKVEQFFGVGKVTAQKMHELGIFTGLDLKNKSKEFLIQHFGKAGYMFYDNARGIDLRQVEPNRITKSVSAETTFHKDLNEPLQLIIELYHVAKEMMERMQDEKFQGRTLTLKVKYEDFKIISRSKTFPQKLVDFEMILSEAKKLLAQVDLSQKKVRLLGLGVSNAADEIFHESQQLELDLF